MNKICIVTATRAEYGLLRNLIRKIDEDGQLELCLFVTGTHLCRNYGYTVQEILEDGFEVREQIPILTGNEKQDILESMGAALIGFGKAFEKEKPDLLVVLGDRFEIMSVCQAAMVLEIPIAHISGGELTQGVIDDNFRHCITKMSQLHFPGCETYRNRIIQLGEEPTRVFNFGDIGVENIYAMNYMKKKELEKSIGFTLDRPYACVTFHPVTIENASVETQIKELLKALEYFDDMKFIITKANADAGGELINRYIDAFVEMHKNCRAFYSLGIRRYLSALKYAQMVIGNSSSGIVEAPCFLIPTVNIGDRQKGRLQADGIINCPPNERKIREAIEKARSKQWENRAKNAQNPYGRGETTDSIIEEIKKFLEAKSCTKKTFYDMMV